MRYYVGKFDAPRVPLHWLETQTPQFPAQYGTHNYLEWEKLRAGR